MKIKISKKMVLNFVLLLPFMEPYIIQAENGQLHRFFLILKLMSCAVIFLPKIYKLTRNKIRLNAINPVFISWAVFWLYLLANTFLQGDMTNNFFIGVISLLALMWWIGENKTNMHDCITVLMFWAEILIYLNFICMILFPSGMYVSASTGNSTNWILGYDNFFEQTFIPAYVIGLVYAYQNKKFMRTLVLIAVMHISAFITMPGTLVVVLLFMDILLVFGIYRFKKVFDLGLNTIIIFAAMNGILFFDIQTKIGSIIFELLNKDVTFTGRTVIWQLTIELIQESPIFGYGFSDGNARLAKMNYILKGAFNAHNQILEFLWEGGFILLILFIICIIASVKQLRKAFGKSVVAQYFVLGISAVLITFIAKAYIQMTPAFIFILWGLVDYVGILGDESNVRESGTAKKSVLKFRKPR